MKKKIIIHSFYQIRGGSRKFVHYSSLYKIVFLDDIFIIN